jgi:hypothetical protein
MHAARDTLVNFTAHPDLRNIVKLNNSGIGATQACEDAIGLAKNSRKELSGRRYRRPEAVMATVLGAKLLEQRHRYAKPLLEVQVVSKAERLKAAAFRPSIQGRSLPFAEVVSHSPGTSWWSPSAQGSISNAADLSLFRLCEHDVSLVTYAWLGQLVQIKHKYIFQQEPLDDAGKWYLALGFIDDSAVLAWPCKLRRVDGSDKEWAELDTIVGSGARNARSCGLGDCSGQGHRVEVASVAVPIHAYGYPGGWLCYSGVRVHASHAAPPFGSSACFLEAGPILPHEARRSLEDTRGARVLRTRALASFGGRRLGLR